MTTIVREVFVLHRTKDKAMHHTKEKGVHDTDSLKQQTHTSNFKKKSDFVLFSHNIDCPTLPSRHSACFEPKTARQHSQGRKGEFNFFDL